MHKILNHCGEIRRIGTSALRYALHGTGTVLIGTGTALIGAGHLLQCCGRKLKPGQPTPAQPKHPRSVPRRRTQTVRQPAA